MAEFRDLYQELILEHSKAPRNYRALPAASRKVEGYNPLCGDRFTIYVEMDGETIRNIGFEGAGCAISKASASMMTQSVKGKSRAEAERLFERFHQLVTGQPAAAGEPMADGNAPPLGKLEVFSGVSEFPLRVKCATLAWHALHAALEGKQESISTE